MVHVCKCVCASICLHVYASIMHCLVWSLGPNLQTDLDVFLSTEMRPSFAIATSKVPVKYWPSNLPNGGGSIILLLRQLCAGIDCDEASSYCYYMGFCWQGCKAKCAYRLARIVHLMYMFQSFWCICFNRKKICKFQYMQYTETLVVCCWWWWPCCSNHCGCRTCISTGFSAYVQTAA